MLPDPESLLGIKSDVLKVAVAASLLGVVWSRQFRFAEAMSAIAAGFGSAGWIAPMLLAHSGIADPEVKGGIIFIVGLVGTHVFAGVTTHAPAVVRRLIARFTGIEPAPSDKPQNGGGA